MLSTSVDTALPTSHLHLNVSSLPTGSDQNDTNLTNCVTSKLEDPLHCHSSSFYSNEVDLVPIGWAVKPESAFTTQPTEKEWSLQEKVNTLTWLLKQRVQEIHNLQEELLSKTKLIHEMNKNSLGHELQFIELQTQLKAIQHGDVHILCREQMDQLTDLIHQQQEILEFQHTHLQQCQFSFNSSSASILSDDAIQKCVKHKNFETDLKMNSKRMKNQGIPIMPPISFEYEHSTSILFNGASPDKQRQLTVYQCKSPSSVIKNDMDTELRSSPVSDFDNNIEETEPLVSCTIPSPSLRISDWSPNLSPKVNLEKFSSLKSDSNEASLIEKNKSTFSTFQASTDLSPMSNVFPFFPRLKDKTRCTQQKENSFKEKITLNDSIKNACQSCRKFPTSSMLKEIHDREALSPIIQSFSFTDKKINLSCSALFPQVTFSISQRMNELDLHKTSDMVDIFLTEEFTLFWSLCYHTRITLEWLSETSDSFVKEVNSCDDVELETGIMSYPFKCTSQNPFLKDPFSIPSSSLNNRNADFYYEDFHTSKTPLKDPSLESISSYFHDSYHFTLHSGDFSSRLKPYSGKKTFFSKLTSNLKKRLNSSTKTLLWIGIQILKTTYQSLPSFIFKPLHSLYSSLPKPSVNLVEKVSTVSFTPSTQTDSSTLNFKSLHSKHTFINTKPPSNLTSFENKPFDITSTKIIGSKSQSNHSQLASSSNSFSKKISFLNSIPSTYSNAPSVTFNNKSPKFKENVYLVPNSHCHSADPYVLELQLNSHYTMHASAPSNLNQKIKNGTLYLFRIFKYILRKSLPLYITDRIFERDEGKHKKKKSK